MLSGSTFLVYLHKHTRTLSQCLEVRDVPGVSPLVCTGFDASDSTPPTHIFFTGLLQLVAYGSQDIYLTGTPVISFFKSVYKYV